MRELYVGQRTEEGEDGQKYCFDYYILVDQMCVSDGFACESYGVKIAAADGSEGAQLPHVTVSVSRIDELMELLLRNTVTPSTLRDVVMDWLE